MADLSQQLAQWQHTARFRFPLLIKPRAEDSHKGTFGTVAVVGSAAGMSGAGVLAASAALKGGRAKYGSVLRKTACRYRICLIIRKS